MANKSTAKAVPLNLSKAQQISFPDRKPEPYYNEYEKEQLQSHRSSIKKAKNIKKRKDTSDSESEESSDSATPPPKKTKSRPSGKGTVKSKYSTQPREKEKEKKYDEEEKAKDDDDDNKGLLNRMVTAVKDVASDSKPKKKETSVVIELPRDILTAYFLMRLPRDKSRGVEGREKPAYWDEYAIWGKFLLFLSVLIPYTIQYIVLGSLLANLATQWELLQAENQTDFWYNSTAFAVLFLYMWKDLSAFYYSVFFYINWLTKKSNAGITKRLKDVAVTAKDVTVAVADKVAGDSHKSNTSVAIDMGSAVQDVKTTVKFVEFRLWLLSVIVLYFGLTAYSLLSIPLQNGIVDKLEVSLSIFFILEVDDWAYELFIAQANILEDDEFDVYVVIEKDRAGHIRKQQKHLAWTISLLLFSVIGFWGASILF